MPPEVWGVCCVARVPGVGAAWVIIWVVAVSVVWVVTAIGVSVATANPLTPIVVITIVVTLRHHRV